MYDRSTNNIRIVPRYHIEKASVCAILHNVFLYSVVKSAEKRQEDSRTEEENLDHRRRGCSRRRGDIYLFYESVVEADLEQLTSVQVSLAKAEGLRLSLNVCCKADLSAFAAKPNVRYEADEDYRHIVFLAEGGAAK